MRYFYTKLSASGQKQIALQVEEKPRPQIYLCLFAANCSETRIHMKKCTRCGVVVLNDTDVCPLCDTVLQQTQVGEVSDSLCSDTYPDIGHKMRRFRLAERICMYVLVMLQLALVIINYYTYTRVPLRWSVITGAAIIYIVLTIYDWMNRRAGHITKIYLQVIGLIALILCIDLVTGFHKWSLEYGFPCVILAMDLVIILCMIIDSANWQNYVVMQVFAVLLSVICMILYWTGIIRGVVLPWTTLGVSVILWTGTLIIGDRKATNELKRKFHI